jgi:hypothetical protein
MAGQQPLWVELSLNHTGRAAVTVVAGIADTEAAILGDC